MAAKKSIRENFEKYFDPIVIHDACWLWKGCRDKDGYGKLTVMRPSGKSSYRPVGAHRISWEIHFGEIPEGMLVLHRCDTPRCVNPAHLFLGTPNDNMQDKVKKKRHSFGTKNGIAKLTESDVIKILSGEKTWTRARELALELGVTPENVSMIMHRKSWKHM
jgi:hypothetical protein